MRQPNVLQQDTFEVVEIISRQPIALQQNTIELVERQPNTDEMDQIDSSSKLTGLQGANGL